MNWRSISHSNLGRRLTCGWCQTLPLSRFGPTEIEHRKVPWSAAWASSNSSHGVQNDVRFLPTRSRLWEELVLRTYHGENGPREASDGEAAWVVFNDGGDGVRWRSGSKDCSGGDGVGGGSSSKRWIGAGVSDAMARWQRHGSAMTARVRPNSHWIGHYL
jgi:hypothetical protein